MIPYNRLLIDRKKDGHVYIPEIEEAFAEFGALLCLYSMVSKGVVKNRELVWAVNHVKSKKGLIKHYSNGAILFERYKTGNFELKDLLLSYC